MLPPSRDLLMVVSADGFGLIDSTTGVKIARDRHPDPATADPSGPDLACPGIGVLAGTRVPIAGLFGCGLHATTGDGWTIDVVAPEWPSHRVLLSAGGGRYDGPPGRTLVGHLRRQPLWRAARRRILPIRPYPGDRDQQRRDAHRPPTDGLTKRAAAAVTGAAPKAGHTGSPPPGALPRIDMHYVGEAVVYARHRA